MESKLQKSKIEATIQSYGRFTSEGGLLDGPEDKRRTLRDYLGNIVKKLTDKTRDIIENESNSNFVQGELVLYDILTNAGVNDITAAKTVVLYPDASKFDPTLFGNNRILQSFRRDLDSGGKPLETLARIAEYFDAHNSKNGYEAKLESFKKFVKSQNGS